MPFAPWKTLCLNPEPGRLPVVPHRIEPAASGRAKCRACKTTIEKGALRLGEEVPNPFGEGEAKHWYHMRCGALRRPEAFLEALESAPEEAESQLTDQERQELPPIAESGKTYYRLRRFVKVQVASSGRARCQGCRELIEKGALRFVLERIEDGMVSGAGFVHVECSQKYAGSVRGILERVSAQSELSDEEWARVTTTLEEQASLPEVVIERRAT
jgi:hypothetical protein